MKLSIHSARCLLVLLPALAILSARERSQVELIRTPEGGVQPQAAVDGRGVLHLVYMGGDPAASDIFYVRKGLSASAFSKPLRANSQPGSAIAIGTVRGAHMAVGKNGRVHVVWMGSKSAEPRGPGGASPMLYARMNDSGTAFERQQNVMQFATGLDGGASVAADRAGNVYVTWHASDPAKGEGEVNRRVWIARSADEGKTFESERAAFSEPTGACGCCGMRAAADSKGALYILYRTATESIHRDMFLLFSSDRGRSFQGTRIHKWDLNACPMSTDYIATGREGVLVAWETANQVYYAEVEPATAQIRAPVAAPEETGKRKHPVVAADGTGKRILVWTEGTGWKKGGWLAWQIYDRANQPAGPLEQKPGVPAWSLAAVVPHPEGGFTIIY